MEKGLKQGDPVAPFLFIISAEGLSGLMRQALTLNKFSSFRFNDVPETPDALLQFADDTLFLGEETLQNMFAVKSILRCFELIAGLKVNFNKRKLEGLTLMRGICTGLR